MYAIAFSPNGEFLASGTVDGSLYLWSVRDGKVMTKYFGNYGAIYDIAWNKEGSKVSACFASKVVCVLDFSIYRNCTICLSSNGRIRLLIRVQSTNMLTLIRLELYI